MYHKWFLNMTLNRKKLNIRIDSDLHDLLSKKAPTTLTKYVESLIVQGLTAEISDIYDKAENSYQTAVLAARNEALKAKEAEIAALELDMKKVHSRIDSQIEILSNFLVSEGITRETIKACARRTQEENRLISKLRFANILVVEIARMGGYDTDTIRSWLKNH